MALFLVKAGDVETNPDSAIGNALDFNFERAVGVGSSLQVKS